MIKIRVILFAILAIVLSSKGLFAQQNIAEQTVVFLIRHAEQDKEIREDPPLNAQGKARAVLLADILSKTVISGAYSTTLKRAKETAVPVIERHKAEWTTYDLKDDEQQLFTRLIQKYKGKNILLIGHSGNIVELLQAATKSNRFDDTAVDGFSDFYILTFIGDSPATVTRLTYGQ